MLLDVSDGMQYLHSRSPPIIHRDLKSHNLFVIEDNAQAIGNVYTKNDGATKKTGTIGTIGTTSFFPSKNSIFVNYVLIVK